LTSFSVFRDLRSVIGVWLLGAVSCVGDIGGDSQSAGRMPAAGADPGAPGASTPGSCPGGPWRTTTLTREQYINAASDLLALDVRPLTTLADAGRTYVPGAGLTALQVEQRMETAEAIAAAAAAPGHLARILPCNPADVGEVACATRFIEQIGGRAFRRPPSAEAVAALRKVFDAGNAAGGFAVGVEWLIAGILQAPDFLYHLAPRPVDAAAGARVPLDGHTLASRLAFFLWNSAPDPELLAAASSGALDTGAGLTAEVRRLLADPRMARARDDFHQGWLSLDDLANVARDARELTPALVADLRRSALLGIADVYRNGAKVEALLGSSTLFANEAIERVYGLPPVGAADLRAVMAPVTERRGLLTHPALLALLASPDASDPIRRGLFIEEKILCQQTPEPIDDVPQLPPLRPGLSTRARLEQHRSHPACAACHRLFDPIGMAFENYDAIGRYRATDQGVPVDSSGEIAQGIDLDGTFADGMELLGRLATSGTVRDCLARHWLEYAVSRHLEPADRCLLEPLAARFRQSGDLLELVAGIAESEAFRFQTVEE
jgi:hypothetical protein